MSNVIFVIQKMDDEEADARRNPVSTESNFVLSNRTIGEVRYREQSE